MSNKVIILTRATMCLWQGKFAKGKKSLKAVHYFDFRMEKSWAIGQLHLVSWMQRIFNCGCFLMTLRFHLIFKIYVLWSSLSPLFTTFCCPTICRAAFLYSIINRVLSVMAHRICSLHIFRHFKASYECAGASKGAKHDRLALSLLIFGAKFNFEVWNT